MIIYFIFKYFEELPISEAEREVPYTLGDKLLYAELQIFIHFCRNRRKLLIWVKTNHPRKSACKRL